MALTLALLQGCGGSEDRMPSAASTSSGFSFNQVVRADEPGAQFAGRFDASDGYLSSSRRFMLGSGADSRATFAMDVPRTGYYEVYAWWPQAQPQAGRVEVRVTHRDGEFLSMVDQRALGGQWNRVGTFSWAVGDKARLQLRAQADGHVLADAVRYQFVGDTPPALAFVTDALPVGLQDHAYEGQLEVKGGEAPYRFRVASGRLPEGLRLDGDEGAVVGRAAKPGAHDITLEVRDARGAVALQTLTIQVNESLDLEPLSTPASARLGAGTAGRKVRALSGSDSGSLAPLLATISALPEGEWHKANVNLYSDVWAPPELRPLYFSGNPTPSKIIGAWSSFTWDSNRNMLILYGGGHANYRGNDVYVWRASTQQWERGSLPSEMVQDALGNWNAIDGADRAPASAHTYDNAVFLPGHDRMLMVGGAADANGGHYLRQDTSTTSRKTGAYLFDPSRVHPDKVGGSSGSHVRRVAAFPEVVGGDMWSNRDMWLTNTGATPPPKEAFVNGCSASAVEGGKDVAYFRTVNKVYRYTINDLSDPALDRWDVVGTYWSGPASKAVCSYDTERRTLVRTGSQTVPFVYWNLQTPSPTNRDVRVVPTDPAGEFMSLLASNAIKIADCGLEYDPVRKDHKLWCSDGRVWSLKAPPVLSDAGWTITKQPAPGLPVPNGVAGTGVLGKWKYVAALDVFIGLQDSVQGNVWLYKPVGWQAPGGVTPNQLPSVSLTSPVPGASFELGSPIAMAATATDPDGGIARVEFFAGGVKIGEDSTAPFELNWSGAGVGTHVLTATATDNAGAQRTSAPVSIAVVEPTPVNQPPLVSWVSPADASAFAQGTPIVLEAAASDADGGVERVEFYRQGVLLGSATQAPYQFQWNGAPLGASTVYAVAMDGQGATATSGPVTLQVTGEPGTDTTVVLQRDLNGYAGVSETYLSVYHPNTTFGSATSMQDQGSSYKMLTRFAIFQSEGGPVPNGATIVSARLSIFKSTSYDMTYGLHQVLKPWSEGAATWISTGVGLAWAVPGAGGLGVDYASSSDATAAVEWAAGWLTFDVTGAVQQWSAGSPASNRGWQVLGQSGNLGNRKKFHTSEFAADAALRPKLEVTFR
jgi:hypothetical protein